MAISKLWMTELLRNRALSFFSLPQVPKEVWDEARAQLRVRLREIEASRTIRTVCQANGIRLVHLAKARVYIHYEMGGLMHRDHLLIQHVGHFGSMPPLQTCNSSWNC